MPLLERCDYFLPSRGEAALFARPGESEEAVCQRLSYNKAVALKDGSNGSYVFHRGEQRHLSGYRVEEVDSTGAGDTYDGAFIAALMDGKDLWSGHCAHARRFCSHDEPWQIIQRICENTGKEDGYAGGHWL